MKVHKSISGVLNNRDFQRRALSLFEQMLFAVMNLFGMVLFARWLSVKAFGTLAMALALWYFFETIQRTTVIIPFMIEVPDPKASAEAFGGWFVFNLCFAVLSGLMIFLLSFLPVVTGEWMSVFQYAACILPAYMLFFFSRRALFHLEDFRSIVIFFLSFAAIYGTGILLLYFNILDKKIQSIIGMLFAAHVIPGIFSAVHFVRYMKISRRFYTIISHSGKLMYELGGAGLASFFSNNGIQLLLGFLSGPYQVAVFSATRTLTRPVNLILVAVNDVERSKASKIFTTNGMVGLNNFLHKMYYFLLGLSMLPIAGMVLFPEVILNLVYHNTEYVNYSLELRLWAIALIPMFLVLPVDIKLSIIKDTNFLLKLKSINAIVVLSAVVCLHLTDNLTAMSGIGCIIFGRVILLLFELIRNAAEKKSGSKIYPFNE